MDDSAGSFRIRHCNWRNQTADRGMERSEMVFIGSCCCFRLFELGLCRSQYLCCGASYGNNGTTPFDSLSWPNDHFTSHCTGNYNGFWIFWCYWRIEPRTWFCKFLYLSQNDISQGTRTGTNLILSSDINQSLLDIARCCYLIRHGVLYWTWCWRNYCSNALNGNINTISNSDEIWIIQWYCNDNQYGFVCAFIFLLPVPRCSLHYAWDFHHCSTRTKQPSKSGMSSLAFRACCIHLWPLL